MGLLYLTLSGDRLGGLEALLGGEGRVGEASQNDSLSTLETSLRWIEATSVPSNIRETYKPCTIGKDYSIMALGRPGLLIITG